MSDDAIYRQNPDVALREEDESGSLLFNPDTGEVLVINDTGRYIWKACKGGASMDDIQKGIRKVYKDVPEEILHDVQEFMTIMTGGGFIGSS